MRYKIFVVLLLAHAGVCKAQNYVQVEHLKGTSAEAGNQVEVSPYGVHPGSVTFGEISPYHIGNKDRANGYDFTFSEPVKKVKINLAAINSGELIEVGVNGKKYILSEGELSPCFEAAKEVMLPVLEEGNISFHNKFRTANATVTIAPGYDINSVYVHHLNGKAAGSVFELWYEGSAPATTDQVVTSTGSVSTTGKKLNLYPNPSDGSFTISGNGFNGDAVMLQIVNVAGQELVRKTVTPLNGVIKEQVNMSQDIPNGVYTVLLTADDQQQALRFTLNR